MDKLAASLYFRLRAAELAILLQHAHILETPTIRGSRHHYERLLKLCGEYKTFTPRAQDALARAIYRYTPDVEKLTLLQFYNDSYNVVAQKTSRAA